MLNSVGLVGPKFSLAEMNPSGAALVLISRKRQRTTVSGRLQPKGEEIMGQAKGFVESLFDFSFTFFVTSKIIKMLYGLSIAGAALLALVLITAGFNVSAGTGLFTLIFLAPLVFFLGVIYSRVILELVIVLFRISEHAAEIARQTRGPSNPDNR